MHSKNDASKQRNDNRGNQTGKQESMKNQFFIAF